jgi:hypothetical protein
MDPHPGAAPDPAIFVTDLQEANKKQFLNIFSAYYFWKVHLHKSQNIRNQGVSYHFGLMIEGSGSGSIPLINGSVSKRTQNIRIRRIRIRTRIRNFALYNEMINLMCADIY